MSTSPSSAPSPSISKSEYYSSLPWFRRFLAMLNWRPVVDYELREIEFDRREIEYEQRMQQLESEDAQLRKDDEQSKIAHEQRKIEHEQRMGLPWFRGQVDRSHAMTLRLSIDDQPNQDKAPVHGAAKAGGRRALPQ